MATRHLIWLFIIGLVVTGCSGGRNQNQFYDPTYEKYFTGTEGVEARFQNFPTQLYYYGSDDNSGSEFSFGVELQNEGASFTRGGVYVSGFDPRLLIFREIPIFAGPQEACGLSFGTIAFGQIGAIFRCDGASFAAAEGGYYNLRIDSFNDMLGGLLARHDKAAWARRLGDFGINAEYNDGDGVFNVNWGTGSSELEYYQHGRLFVGLGLVLDFIKNGGREFLLAGDTYEYPGGEYAYFVYNGRIANWPAGLDETEQKLLLTTCYQYTTFAAPIVCVDPEPYSENRKVCQPRGRSYGSNGAPVAIRSIEQENTPRKIIFHINVENVGGGTVYDAGRLEKCSPYYPGRVTPEDLNVIYLGDVRIGNSGLSLRGGDGITCAPEVIRLDPRTGRGSTTCTYPLEFTQLKSAYQAPLTVELWYGYSEVEERSVRIKRVI